MQLKIPIVIHSLALCILGTSGLAAGPKPSRPSDVTLLVEAEDFQFPGGWKVVGDADALGRKYLMPDGSDNHPPDALTAVTLPQAGEYHLWARTRDYKTYLPGVRRFKLAIDGQPLEKELGAHGNEGFAWELVGTVKLDPGDHMLALRFTTSIFARCDAILLTTALLDPRSATAAQLAAWRVRPRSIEVESPKQLPGLPELRQAASTQPLAALDNGRLRVKFTASLDETGATVVTRQLAVRVGDSWTAVSQEPSVEWIFALSRKDSAVTFHEGKPRWNSQGPVQSVHVGGRSYEVHTGADDPFSAGSMTPLVARAARQIDDKTVELSYAGTAGSGIAQAVGRWTLEPDRYDLKIAVSVEPLEEASYSLGFCGFAGYDRDQVEFVQLPPLYQFQRLPDRPLMVTSSFTPHPLALAQVAAPSGQGCQPLSLAVVGEPSSLPMRWPTAHNPIYGFSLLGPTQAVQPSIFSPVLGLEGSHWTAGRKHQVAW